MDNTENDSGFKSHKGGGGESQSGRGYGASVGQGASILDILFGMPDGGRDQQDSQTSQYANGRGSTPINVDFSKAKDKYTHMNKKGKFVFWFLIIVILAIAYWWFHPPINPQSKDFWMIIFLIFLLPSFVIFRFKMEKHAVMSGQETKRTYKMKHSNNPVAFQGGSFFSRRKTINLSKLVGKARKYQILSFVPVAIFIILICGALTSVSFFPGNAEKYFSVLDTEMHKDFSRDVKEVDYLQIPVIDHDTAVQLGNRELGNIPEYVSQFTISDLYSQINFLSKPVRVSPLNYADLFKWLTNRENGLPAYVLVDMTTQNIQIKKLPIGDGVKYSTSEPLARNIDRYIQLKYPFYMFDEFSFDIDDNGHPYWICPVQVKKIGLFGGTDIQRVILCDACTGDCQDLPIEQCPQWVDRAYPSDLLIQQFNWRGSYVNGWINSWLGQKDVVKTTPGVRTSNSNGSVNSQNRLGYNYIAKDDDVWVYTGITSATGVDNSIVGFVLINQRTGKAYQYQVAGATEASAMESAEGQVQEKKYAATFPILINIADRPTYFMSLKDNAGVVKKFAMVDIQRYQNVATGDTVKDCQAAYLKLLSSNADINISNSKAVNDTSIKVSGKIAKISQAVVDSNSNFYVTLEGDQNIYLFRLPEMINILKYSVGNDISFTVAKDNDIIKLENGIATVTGVD